METKKDSQNKTQNKIDTFRAKLEDIQKSANPDDLLVLKRRFGYSPDSLRILGIASRKVLGSPRDYTYLAEWTAMYYTLGFVLNTSRRETGTRKSVEELLARAYRNETQSQRDFIESFLYQKMYGSSPFGNKFKRITEMAVSMLRNGESVDYAKLAYDLSRWDVNAGKNSTRTYWASVIFAGKKNTEELENLTESKGDIYG